ncbi:MAG: MBL fold metallo-hydrolase [Clostridia bacterium]|nr:MBL fold metallo-hydrolase [Clostridia bacterium]
MKITALMDNISLQDDLYSEHGLSLYIETEDKRILFDTGKTGLFYENAELLGIDIAQVNVVILSHGHYDHGGGLGVFFEHNNHAQVYVAKGAFDMRYGIRESGEQAYIGLDQSLKGHPQICEMEGFVRLDNKMTVFSGVTGGYPRPVANGNLVSLSEEGVMFLDDFEHEQNLMIEEKGKRFLFAGCAHNGICNIVEYATETLGLKPDYVIGGFHLHNRLETLCATEGDVAEVAQVLLESGAVFYTGHCTGEVAYEQLKDIMGDHIFYLSVGMMLTF